MIYDFSPWMRSTLCHDQVIKWTKAKVHVYSDSVSCLKELHDHSEANEKWWDKISEFQQSNEYAELQGTGGEPIEFEWNIFQGFTSIQILRQIQKDLNAGPRNPEQFQEIVLFVSMFNDIDWKKNGNSAECIWTSKHVSDYAKEFPRGHWSFLGPGNEEKWYGTYAHKPEGTRDQQGNQTIDQFQQSGHPIFRGTSALDRGVLKRQSGRNTVHFTADAGNIELMLRTIHSGNQLSIYGAVSNWCIDLAEKMHGQTSTGVDTSISEENDQISKHLDSQEVVSKPAKDRRGLGKLLASSLATIRNDESRCTTSHRMWWSRIHKDSL